MMMFVLTACGETQDGEGVKECRAEADSLEDADSRDGSVSRSKARGGDLKPFATDATIAETVLMDENEIDKRKNIIYNEDGIN